MTQRTEDDFKWMTPEQVVEAHLAGEFNDLVGASRYPSTGQLKPEHLGVMSPEEIRKARDEGRLTDVLGTTD